MGGGGSTRRRLGRFYVGMARCFTCSSLPHDHGWTEGGAGTFGEECPACRGGADACGLRVAGKRRTLTQTDPSLLAAYWSG